MTSFRIKTTLCYLMVIFILAPAIITAAVGFFSMSGFSSGSVSQYARSAGKAQSELLNQCIGEYENMTELLAGNEKVKAFAQSGMAGDENEQKFLSSLLDSMTGEEYDMRTITVLNTDGTVIFDNSGLLSPGEYFYGFEEMENLSAGQTFISTVQSPEKFDSEVFFLAQQLQNDNSERIGYITVTVGTEKLTQLLNSTNYGQQGNGYLVLSDGKDTVFNFEGAQSQRISALAVGNPDMSKIFKSEARESGTVFDYEASGNIGSYGYITGVSNTSWKWISIYPSNAAISQIFIPLIVAVGSMLLAAVIFALLGQFLARVLVAPMKRMVHSIRDIQTSRYSTRLDNMNVHGEYHKIAELFNGMLDEICLSEELHKTVSEISDNMLFEWDYAKESMYLSENFIEMFGITAEESRLAEGEFLDKLMTPEFADEFNKGISSMLKNRNGYSGEYQIKNKSGVTLWFAVRIMCVTDRLGEPLRIIGVVTDIDNEKKLELQLSVRASYDFLSQLYNRSTFERECVSEMERSAHSRVCIVFVDVDDFKFINDRYGHSVGDEVIKFVSDKMKKWVENSGFAGRFGGDEFVMCITDPQQIDNVENMAMDLIDELYSGYHSELSNVTINIRAGVGIAIYPEHGKTSAAVIAAADEAMYFVKKNGKANYHVYRPEDSDIEDLQHTL